MGGIAVMVYSFTEGWHNAQGRIIQTQCFQDDDRKKLNHLHHDILKEAEAMHNGSHNVVSHLMVGSCKSHGITGPVNYVYETAMGGVDVYKKASRAGHY